MEEKRLKYRMYFFVPYNISPIQQAIQAGHAALEYAMKYYNIKNQDFLDFMKNDKTWIILNGGTTRSMPEDPGTMQELLNEIFVFNEQNPKDSVKHALFHEPDLNNAMTAVCFLADERVWDYETYPDFFNFILEVKMTVATIEEMPAENYIMLKKKTTEELKVMFPNWYPEWIEFLGGEKNLFLRELLKGKKLA